MTTHKDTSAVTDGLLRFLAVGGSLVLTGIAPNALIALDKPLQRYFRRLDRRASDREYIRIVQSMKRQGLIKIVPRDYEHGMVLTKKGLERAQRANIDALVIPQLKEWDGKWRIIFYDIPELHKTARNKLTFKLRSMNFWQLQRSVWVHPFPCRNEIEAITNAYEINQFVTYIETAHIDAHQKLMKHFSELALKDPSSAPEK